MKNASAFAVLTSLFLLVPASRAAEPVSRTVSTEVKALDAYDGGFAFDVMRDPGGVVLNDLVLLEDDGPGAGRSEKGTWTEDLHAGVQARKTIDLDDPAAEEAHVVLYLNPQNQPDQAPYYIVFNGHRIEGNPIPWHDSMWHWVQVPVEFLKKGPNEIVVGCDAPAGKGYQMLIARDDEYDAGGGKFQYQGNTALIASNQLHVPTNGEEVRFLPIHVGDKSAKSTDNGQTWRKLALGTTNDVLGEYVIRLNLKRHKPAGSLRSAAIDLWDGLEGLRQVQPQCQVSGLTFHGQANTPPDTDVTWSVRFADTPDMKSDAWGDFKPVAKGGDVSVPIDNGGRRYLQWEARLETRNPLATPVVRATRVERTLTYAPPPVNTFYVRDYDNPVLRYSSYDFAYEDARTPQLAELRKRLKLDAVVEPATGDFDKISRLRHYVSQLWYHGDPLPGYPEWNALDILDRRDRCGVGGMCIQFSIVFIQSLESLGYQARHVNIFNHETVEVYIDELGKWVHQDPESVFDSYEYNTETGTPLNALEQHRYFLAEYGLTAQNPIDWMSTKPWCRRPQAGLKVVEQPLEISTYTAWLNSPDPAKRPPQHELVGFIRMMPRNNYFSQPTPRPLTQGCTWWPWDGYVNWYDEATPRKLQYALHTDRPADFYPTLNQVAFSAVYGEKEGDVIVDLTSFTPNFDTYEINVDGKGWEPSAPHFTWTLNRSALNTLAMRTRNLLGVTGKPSRIQVFYHYREPYRPKVAEAKK